MLSNWPIRYKLLVGIALLLVIVAALSFSGFHAVYSYRDLAKSISQRAGELPPATELSQHVGNLRVTLSKARAVQQRYLAGGASLSGVDNPPGDDHVPLAGPILREDFRMNFNSVRATVARYRQTLSESEKWHLSIGDGSDERQTLSQIEAALERIEKLNRDEDWMFHTVKADQLGHELEGLQTLTTQLPSHLHRRIQALAGEVKGRYRTLILATWLMTALSLVVLGVYVKWTFEWVFRPLRTLIAGSRRVANDDFSHRIHLETTDEMSELADAMNNMTERFETIRADLDHQVQQRTREVVRSEQLASLGFLAAGVSHEINNPLASIAMCAESLESRVRTLLCESDEDHQVIGSYLRMIQTEAFRCKEITDRLLDFSRMGDLQHQPTEMRELVQGVIEMVHHLDKYQGKTIELAAGEPVVAEVSPQEIKQVVLNLITNGLDSVDEDGRVQVQVARRDGVAELVVVDNGCGMTADVLGHLFEPFFTRRRSGQGTGLGLSIAYRIVQQHHGQIVAGSDGPDQGSRLCVTLPLLSKQPNKETEHQYQAA